MTLHFLQIVNRIDDLQKGTAQTGYITFLLQPHFKHFNKRLVKSPKLFWIMQGLLAGGGRRCHDPRGLPFPQKYDQREDEYGNIQVE